MTTNQIPHEVYSNPPSDQPITYLTKVISHQELSVTTIDTKEDLSDPNEFDEVMDLNSSDPNYYLPPFLMNNHQQQHSFVHYQSESHDTHETMSPYLTSETHNNSHNTNNSSPNKPNHHMLDTSSHTNPLTSYDYHPSHLNNNNMRDNDVSNHSSPTTTSDSASPVLTNPSLHLNINNIIDNFSKRYEDIYIKSNSKSKKAHFDCIPKDNNVVDGAKMTWCPLLLFDAMVNFLYSDNYRPQTRRVFNQQDVLYTCILEELQHAANQQLQPDLTDCFLNGQLKPLFQTLLWQMNLQNPINSSVGTTLDVSMYAPFLQSPVPEIQLHVSALKQLEFNEKELLRSYLIMHFLFYSEDFSIQFPNNMILPTLTFSLTYSKWLHLHHMKAHLEENAPSKAKNKHIAISNFFLQSPFLQTNSSNSFFLTTPLSGLFQMVICKVIYLHAMKDMRKESASLASKAMVVQALVPRSLSLKVSDYPPRPSRLSTHGSERLDNEQAEKNLMLSRGERHLYNNKRYAKREHAAMMLQGKDTFPRDESTSSTKDMLTEDIEVKQEVKRVCRVSPSPAAVGVSDPQSWRKQFLHKLSPYINDDAMTSTHNTTTSTENNTLQTTPSNANNITNMMVPRYASAASVGSTRNHNNGLMHCQPTETSDSETSDQFSYDKHRDSSSFQESHNNMNNCNDPDQFMGVYDPIFSTLPLFDSHLLASSFVHPNKDNKELEYLFERLDKNHHFPYEMSSSMPYFPHTSSLSASSSSNLTYSHPHNPHNTPHNNYLPAGYFDGLPAQEVCSTRYVLLSLSGNPYNNHPSYPSNNNLNNNLNNASDVSTINSPNQLHDNTSHKHYYYPNNTNTNNLSPASYQNGKR